MPLESPDNEGIYKKNVEAGASLSFELYEDAGCTSMIGSALAQIGGDLLPAHRSRFLLFALPVSYRLLPGGVGDDATLDPKCPSTP